jgi:hypothetical protein
MHTVLLRLLLLLLLLSHAVRLHGLLLRFVGLIDHDDMIICCWSC